MASAEENQATLEVMMANTDAFFLIVIGILIFFMQGGFAFLEAGAVRSKNTVNILIKNMLDLLLGGVSYWAIGWALAYGPHGNPFCGGSNFFSYGIDYSSYANWFFQFVFAATAATIVSGAIAERVQFTAYFIYSLLITGWVYPPVSHWAWDGSETPGWLNSMGYKDFAGSGVVHLLGGVCALVACILIGPRKGRFDEDGKPHDMQGHSVPLAALGGFILLFGFLAFNGGSQASVSQPGDTDIIARAVINTILGACGAGLSALAINKFFVGKMWSYSLTLNGALAGMVALCAGCNVYQPWAAILVGIMGGLALMTVRHFMFKYQLDDPLDAVAVHGGGGVIGLICVPIFEYQNGILWAGDTAEPWKSLGINIFAMLAIISWSAFWAFAIFFPMKKFGIYRIDSKTEFLGNDMTKHGESAYPVDAWAEVQYNKGRPGTATPPMMSGTFGERKISDKAYNDAFQMMPTQLEKIREMRNECLDNSSVNSSGFISRSEDDLQLRQKDYDNAAFNIEQA